MSAPTRVHANLSRARPVRLALATIPPEAAHDHRAACGDPRGAHACFGIMRAMDRKHIELLLVEQARTKILRFQHAKTMKFLQGLGGESEQSEVDPVPLIVAALEPMGKRLEELVDTFSTLVSEISDEPPK